MNHSSKFAPKAHEGFLLGYGSNSHTYRVYNSHFRKVMETVNVRFDETNGSQKEHLPHDLDEPPLDEVIRSMAIGEIRPVEANAHQADKDDDGPMFPHIARGAGDQHPDENDEQDEERQGTKEIQILKEMLKLKVKQTLKLKQILKLQLSLKQMITPY